jgi:hypothetical protein
MEGGFEFSGVFVRELRWFFDLGRKYNAGGGGGGGVRERENMRLVGGYCLLSHELRAMTDSKMRFHANLLCFLSISRLFETWKLKA